MIILEFVCQSENIFVYQTNTAVLLTTRRMQEEDLAWGSSVNKIVSASHPVLHFEEGKKKRLAVQPASLNKEKESCASVWVHVYVCEW